MIWYEINFLNLIIFFSEIYSKVSQNAMVLAKPAIIHFGGFEVDKKHVQSLQIVNASTEVINMHIIPPQTKYFYIKYKKTVRIKDWIPMLSNFQHTSLKWGGGYLLNFVLFILHCFPYISFVQIEIGTIFVKDLTICDSVEEKIYYQVRAI